MDKDLEDVSVVLENALIEGRFAPSVDDVEALAHLRVRHLQHDLAAELAPVRDGGIEVRALRRVRPPENLPA